MDSELEQRIEKLEIDLAHAMQTIDDLNSVVIEQSRLLERLNRRQIETSGQVEELMEHVLPEPGHDKPPHY
ncbi:SlyX protein [Roseibium hamelinense]|uniref:SlyX protein n=1 Tax=Roseibium hamelinense TaxID=150831 RepID=A0A562T1M4_9HYPH|nr:SlyX family protein [Roseibium hamelinense]MTI43371.1 SlyX family protein [Roseibium hamelinense]TWI87571.1 SlyX protein [Roseibium hamelinense]